MKKWFLLLVAAIMLFTAGCSTPSNTEDIAVQYVFPGEWEEHEGTWLIWPHNYGVIEPEYVGMIDDIWVTMTKALHTGERVHIIAYSEDEQSKITELLTDAGVDMAQVDFVLVESDQFWARDCGPVFVYNTEGIPAILDTGYNGYGRMDKLGPDVPAKDRWEMPEFVREEYLENYTKDDLLASAVAVGAVKLITAHVPGMAVDIARSMTDRIKDTCPDAVAVIAISDAGSVKFLACAGKDAVAAGAHAGKLVGAVAAVTGGKGGGRPDNAMAGGQDVSKIDEALASAADALSKMLK